MLIEVSFDLWRAMPLLLHMHQKENCIARHMAFQKEICYSGECHRCPLPTKLLEGWDLR
jgi:hypothetical protein